MRKLGSLLIVPLSSIFICAATAQQPIHVDVNLVTISFTVRDARGALVDNLAKDDLEVFEDAVPQKIAFFARSTDLPLTLGLIVDASGSQEHSIKKHERDLEVFLKEVLGPTRSPARRCSNI
jgi:VWFA-related protein